MRNGSLKILAFAAAFFCCSLAAGGEPKDVRAPIPCGRDIRELRSPADLDPSDYEALLSPDGGMRYYYERFASSHKERGRSFTTIEMYFMTLINLDYTGVEKFATTVFDRQSGFKSMDFVIAALPNLMRYLESFSVGDIKKAETPLKDGLSEVSIRFVLNEQKLKKRYPTLANGIGDHVKRFNLNVLNADGDMLMELDYERDAVNIRFLLDAGGYFVAYERKGGAVFPKKARLGLEDARRGARIYLDMSFDSSATLIKILKLFKVEIKRLRAAVNFKLYDDRFGIAWRVVEVEPGRVYVAGLSPQPIRDNLTHMEDRLNGTIDFYPAESREGRKLTFMRVYGTGEEIDHWLVDLALLTWEQIGGQFLADLSAPIADALLAAQKDVMNQAIKE